MLTAFRHWWLDMHGLGLQHALWSISQRSQSSPETLELQNNSHIVSLTIS